MLKHLTAAELEACLKHICAAPKNTGRVDLIVRRPAIDHREVLEIATLDLAQGLVGDNWLQRGFASMGPGSARPDMQLNLMNSRVIDLLAQTKDRWPLAGDQFYVDIDLSAANLSAGARLAIGSAVIEVTAEPHLGCKKFSQRFGRDAMKFVNSKAGKVLNLRGINARVIEPGIVKTGDAIFKLS